MSSSSNGKGPNCSLISKADVMSKLGVSGLDDAQMTINDIVTLCAFPEGANPVAVQIRYQTPTDASEFMQGKQGFADNMLSTMDTSDIGDMAYTSSLNAGSLTINTLVFLHGDVEVEIVAPADFDKIKSLGNEIISKL